VGQLSLVSRRDLIRKRTPSGASTEKPLPRPGATATVRWVCFQSSCCDFDIQNGTGRSRPGTGSSPQQEVGVPGQELAVGIAHRRGAVAAAARLVEHERPVLAGQPPQQVCCGGGEVDPVGPGTVRVHTPAPRP